MKQSKVNITYNTWHTKGGDIPYIRAGRGKKLLLLLAFHSDIERFLPLIMYLARYFEVICPELPGIGCKATLNGKAYTMDNYADLYIKFVRYLKLKKYILGGLCMGGIIALKMWEKGIRPKALFLFETFTGGDMLHLYMGQRLLIPFVRLAYTSTTVRNVFAHVLSNTILLGSVFGIVYFKKPNRKQIVAYQVRITTMMHADAVIESVNDMLNMRVFTGPVVKSNVPVFIVAFKDDPILDIKESTKIIQHRFPVNYVFRVDYDDHAPRGPIEESQVAEILGDVVPKMRKMLYSI